MNPSDFLMEVVQNAPVERAAGWLVEAADEYPELFSLITDNLDATPAEIKALIWQKYPLGGMMISNIATADEWIVNLQKFFKEKGF